MSPDIKRRIVYTILSDYITGEELRQVMILWQGEFSERSRYELNQFLGAVTYLGFSRTVTKFSAAWSVW